MGIIRTENLTYTYSMGTPFEKTAISNINLDIPEGEFVGVIGHTGSGKSTLIQHFNGLLKPSSGKIFIEDKDIWESKLNTRNARFTVGLVFQYPEYQIFEDTVYKDIAFGPRNMGLDDAEIRIRIHETINAVGLDEDYLNKSPFELSGGEKRRVAIAGVMAMKPKILILDEPSAGLDPAGREQILGLIKDYHKSSGCTVMIVSHSMEDIARYAQKILVMNEGTCFCYDTVAEVFKQYDKISQIGLTVPQITRVIGKLKENGIPIEDEVYTVKFAKYVLLKIINCKGENTLD